MEKIIKKIQKINWENFWGRKTNVQLSLTFIRGIGSKIFARTYDSCLNHQLTYFNGGVTSGYSKKEEMKKFLKDVEKKFSNDLIFAKSFTTKNNRIVRLTAEKVKRLAKRALKTTSKQRLMEIYKKFIEVENLHYFYGWSNFLWDRFLVDLVHKELEKVCKNKKQTLKLLEIFSMPSYPPPIIQEELSLLSIAEQRDKASPKKINQLIKKHAKKFGWFAVYNFGEEFFSTTYYQNKLKKLLREKINFKEEIRRIKNNFYQNKINFQQEIKKLKRYKKLFILANLLHRVPNMRDEREKYRDEMVFCGTNIYKAISRQLKVPLDLVINFSNQEIIKSLQTGKVGNLNEIRLRKKKYLIYFENDKIEILPNHLIDLIIKKIEIKKSMITSFRGLVAQKGVIRGRVKIILSGDGLSKIKGGDIFVTTMTKPNFVPALKKSAALITDEGSILCHAAIISREFKIPCIIGTKIATKVLKDGDLVEVDANKGIVKILKK